eukprot:gene11617-biopygen9284
MIRVNGWLTELELEQIKRRVLNENDEAIDEDVHDVEEDTDVAAGIDVNTNEDDRFFVVHNDDLSDEEIETLNKLNKIIDEHMDEELVGFKRIERKILKQWVQKINRILPKIKTDNLISTNNLIKACSILVGKEAGLKVFKKQQARVTPWWKRRIQSSRKEIRSHISILDRKRRKELINFRKYLELEKSIMLNEKD